MFAMIANPIIFALGIGNLGAAGYSYWHGDWKIGGVYICYGIANCFLSLVKA